MSVLIKDMKKPKSCYAVIDGEDEYCPFVNTDDDCVLMLKKSILEGTWEEQYSKCPLVETSEPCEDAVSRKAVKDGFIEMCNLNCPYTKKQQHIMCGSCLMGTAFDVLEATPSVTPKQPEYHEIGYRECADAVLKMWMDNVLTDGEHNRIIDKLNAKWAITEGDAE